MLSSSLRIVFLISFLLKSSFSQAPVPISSNIIDWSNAGNLESTTYTASNIISVLDYGAIPDDQNNDYPAIEAAISAAKSMSGITIIYFPVGVYKVNSPITLEVEEDSYGNVTFNGNIVFQGTGLGSILEFNYANNGSAPFTLLGKRKSYISVNGDINKGTNYISASGLASFLDNDDWIHLLEYDCPHTTHSHHVVGQISQLKDENTGQIKDAASKDYFSSNDLRLYEVVPLVNVGIENLYVKRTNTTGHLYNGSNVRYKFAVNNWVRGVKFYKTCEHHIKIEYSSHILISGCYFLNANYKGNNGFGYGVAIQKSSTNCLVENSIFRKLRHAMVVQDGSNANVFGYNYSREQEWECGGGCPDDYGADMLVHGDYAYSNLFEGNIGRRIWLDAAHGWNGPYNTFLRNTTQTEWVMAWNAHKTNIISTYNAIGVTTDQSGIGGFLLAWLQDWDIYASQNVTDVYFNTYPEAPDWAYGYVLTDHATWHVYKDDAFYYNFYISSSFINDISYYYDSKPSFLADYSWPTSYPNTNLDYNNYIEVPNPGIPAKDRYFDSSTPDIYLLVGNETKAANIFWGGTKIIEDDIIINSGETLTIEAGSIIKFCDDKSFTINGTLIVNGESGNKVTFTSLNSGEIWRGIDIYGNVNINHSIIENGWGVRFKEGSSGSVRNSTIRNNASNGVYVYKALPTIQNCTIYHNDDEGIALYSTNYVNSSNNRAQILDNLIYDNGWYNECWPFPDGIYLNRSSPAIRGNEVHSEERGIVCFNYSSPLLGQYDYFGENYIHNNDEGIEAHTNSNPFLGENSCVLHGGNNNISSNTYKNASAHYNSHIQAENNYWGYPVQTSKFYVGSGCSIDYTPYLTSQPTLNMMAGGSSPEKSVFDQQLSLAKQSESEPLETDYMQYYDEKWPLKRKLIFARNINWLGDIAGGQSICKDVMENYPDSSLSLFALDILWESSRGAEESTKYDLDSFNKYLSKYSSKKDKKDLYGHAELISAGFEKDKSKSVSTYDKVHKKYKGESLAELSLYDKFVYYYYDAKDMAMAEQTAQQLETEFPGSHLSKKANSHFKKSTKPGSQSTLAKSADEPVSDASSAIPKDYELSQNYPNPFNPSTKVNFALPVPSIVNISIYNSIGQKIKSFTQHQQSEGYHSATWDGTNDSGITVPSGLYFLKFSAQSINGKLPEFSKTVKMLLVR